MRRMVWRWGRTEEEFRTYGFLIMHFRDRPATCGLEDAKRKLADLRQSIDSDRAK